MICETVITPISDTKTTPTQSQEDRLLNTSRLNWVLWHTDPDYRERQSQANKKWREAHPSEMKAHSTKWRKEHPDERKAIMKRYYLKHRAAHERWHAKLKLEVLYHYSNGTMKCASCGYTNPDALTIDHVKGGGGKHRREIHRSGSSFYVWLRHNGYPAGYQVLCANCQMIKMKSEYLRKYQ